MSISPVPSEVLEVSAEAPDSLEDSSSPATPSGEAVVPERSRSYRVYKALRFWVVLALIVAGALLIGLSGFVVKTGSMRPTFNPGDVVIAVNPNIVKPQVGRVVVATPKVAGEDLPAIAHRVIRTNPDGTLTTKGDYNPEPDAWRDQPADIQKVVIAHVPMGWVRSPLVIAGGIGVLALVFLWPSSKRDKEQEPSAPNEHASTDDDQDPQEVDLRDRANA